jgi:hypothetical protein
LKIDEPRLLVRVVGHLPLLDEARAVFGKAQGGTRRIGSTRRSTTSALRVAFADGK